MRVLLSEHLLLRLMVRKIKRSLPAQIIKNPEYNFFDKETNHYIAVKKARYETKIRPMIAVYDKIEDIVKIITVYPSDDSEILSRLNKGRWVNENEKN